MAPDNDAHSWSLLSRIALGRRATAHATVAWGEMRQDDAFGPYTTNARLAPDALPANSLDGRVRSFAGTFKLVARPADRLRLIVGHRQRQRDNRTVALTFTPVRGDAFALGEVSSRAYDTSRSTTELGVRYRLAPRVGLGLYADSTRIRRDPAEVAANEERRYRIELSVSDWHGLRAKLVLADADRSASEFRNTTRNNPLTRRFHQAAREQRSWRARVGYQFDRLGARSSLSRSARGTPTRSRCSACRETGNAHGAASM